MADINSITSAAGYTGNAALGGGLGVGVTLDPAPLQRLANFIYYRDRDVWEQKQKDNKIAADKIAMMAAFDISSPLKKFSADLQGKLTQYENYVRNNPDSLTYSKDPQAYQEREQMVGRLQNLRRRATANDALYNAELAKIELIVDEGAKALAKKELDLNVNDLFSAGVETAYDKQLASTTALKPSDYVIPTTTNIKRSIITPLPNEIGKTELTYIDLDDAKTKSALLVASNRPDITKEDWFKKFSPERQELALAKDAETGKTRKAMQNISTSYNSYLEEWKKANPTIDLTKITAANVDSLPDGIMEDNIRSAILINDQIDQLNQYVLEGRVKDPLDRVRTKLYKKINFADGLSEDEVVYMKILQDSKNAILQNVDKTIISTNNANEQERLKIEKQNADTSRMNAETARMKADELAESETSGNAFDEIGGGEEVLARSVGAFTNTPFSKKEKIVDGVVYDKKGNKKTGKLKIAASALPANMIAALKTAKVEILPEDDVELIVVDGQINSIQQEGEQPISRQAMENAQKKFDTERKGAPASRWGRTINKPLKKTVNVPGL